MMRNTIAFTVLTALSLVSAQDANYTSTWHLDNPGSVPLGIRSSWCNAQDAACDSLCETIQSRTCEPVSFICSTWSAER